MFAKIRPALLTAITITFIGLTSASYAQSSGATLQGTVTDPAGAVVPNARILIVSQLTGVSRDATSNNEGIYSAPNLSAGRYKVTSSASGFATKVQTDVLLTDGVVRDFDISLTLATTDITITVDRSGNHIHA